MKNLISTILGLIAVAAIIGIWVAWTKGMFVLLIGAVVVAVGAIAAIGLSTRDRETRRS